MWHIRTLKRERNQRDRQYVCNRVRGFFSSPHTLPKVSCCSCGGGRLGAPVSPLPESYQRLSDKPTEILPGFSTHSNSLRIESSYRAGTHLNVHVESEAVCGDTDGRPYQESPEKKAEEWNKYKEKSAWERMGAYR